MKRTFLCLFAALSACVGFADVGKLSSPLAFDGKLDEPAWKSATWESGFQRFRGTKLKSRAVPADTEFAFLADAENLYIGVKAHHRDMKALKARGPSDIWNAEAAEFYLCPSGNTFDFYQFLITYQGTKYAMFYSESGAIHPDPFNPAWEYKVSDDEKGWYAEAKIPLTAFYMTRTSAWKDAWKVNVGRTYREPGADSFNCWVDGKDYRDFAAFRTIGGFPMRRTAEDLYVKSVAVDVKGPKDGKLAGSLALTVSALEGGDFTLETSFSEKAKVTLAAGDTTLTIPAVYPENGRLPTDIRLTRLADGSVHARKYPITVDYQPIRLKLTVPQYRGNFYPGQNSDRVVGHVTAVTDEVTVTLEGPGFGRLEQKLPGNSDFAFDTKGFSFGTALLTVKAGADTFVRKVRKLEPLPEGKHMTWIEDGKLILDGKPVFRRNMYAEYYMGGEKFQKIYDADDLHQTPALKSIGSLEPDRLVRGAEHREATKDVMPSKDVLEAAKKVIEKGKKGNGAFYYICDEPECRQISKVYLKHLYEYVCDLDPYHVTVCCSRNGENSIEFADVFETHPYLNAHKDENGKRVYGRNLNELGGFVDAFRPLAHPDKCIGGTPTCFSYSGGDYPTFEEYLANYWCELLRGARTMFPYAYHDLGDRAALYEGTRYAFSSLEALDSFLFCDVKTLAKTSDYECGLWERADGEKLFCLQNFTSEPLSVEVPGLKGAFYEFRGDRTFESGWFSSTIAFELKPHESLVATTDASCGKDLPTFAETKSLIEKLDGELDARDNQLIGRLFDIDVKTSTRAGRSRKIVDGNRNVIAWYDSWGKNKFYEMTFNGFTPTVDRVVVHGRNVKDLRLKLGEVGKGAAALVKPVKAVETEYETVLELDRRYTVESLRLEFPKHHVELYEIELPKPLPLGEIVLENKDFRLTVGADALVKSLVVKATGEECVRGDEEIALFSSTQDRPFNNEIKLIHPNKRTVYPATSLRKEGDFLIAGFGHKQYEAKVAVKVTDRYLGFELVDFPCDRKTTYDYLRMDIPPVASFRVLQIPVLNRRNFGDWLNASWDEKAAVGVIGTSPYPDIDHENRKGYKLLTADLVRGQKLRGAGAALIAAPGREAFLDAMDALEADYGLPRGVRSRRSKHVDSSIFHTSGGVNPKNIDELLPYVKAGGFKYMTFSYSDMTKSSNKMSWGTCGDYDWRPEYPEKEASLRSMLAKVKAAGIRPGLHTMHSHIGLESRYVTPVADERLNKTRRFTLAAALGTDTNVTELTVHEPTTDVTMFPACRVLQFGGELIGYESYTAERPYVFKGVKRGLYGTTVTAHPKGEVGGILDISEFGTPGSCYLDQNTDLQDEVAKKYADIYNCGFEYIYMDGSEGVNVPFNFHVSNGQYRQWKLLEPAPLFGEGAAKTHFDWHMLSGANAFDCFGPEQFKAKLVEYPFAQAPVVWQEMTRCNFGWWGFYLPHQENYCKYYGVDTIGTQADMWEYGQSVSVAWRCPMTVQMQLPNLKKHPRTKDILETMRRWEVVREKDLMTDAERAKILSDYTQEHHLVKRADGTYKIVPYAQITVGDGKNPVRAFLFEADGARWVVYWHGDGEGRLELPVKGAEITLLDEFAGKNVAFETAKGRTTIPASDRRYLRTKLSADKVRKLFESAKLVK